MVNFVFWTYVNQYLSWLIKFDAFDHPDSHLFKHEIWFKRGFFLLFVHLESFFIRMECCALSKNIYNAGRAKNSCRLFPRKNGKSKINNLKICFHFKYIQMPLFSKVLSHFFQKFWVKIFPFNCYNELKKSGIFISPSLHQQTLSFFVNKLTKMDESPGSKKNDHQSMKWFEEGDQMHLSSCNLESSPFPAQEGTLSKTSSSLGRISILKQSYSWPKDTNCFLIPDFLWHYLPHSNGSPQMFVTSLKLLNEGQELNHRLSRFGQGFETMFCLSRLEPVTVCARSHDNFVLGNFSS